jgi:hypothetical protein
MKLEVLKYILDNVILKSAKLNCFLFLSHIHREKRERNTNLFSGLSTHLIIRWKESFVPGSHLCHWMLFYRNLYLYILLKIIPVGILLGGLNEKLIL